MENKNKFMVSGVFIILALLFIIPGASAFQKEGLLTYLSFDDSDLSGTNVFDLTGQGRNGTNSGATTGEIGILGEAFDLGAATNHVDISDDSQLDLTAGGTINFWAKLTAVGDNARLFDKSTNSGGTGGFTFYHNLGVNYAFYIDNTVVMTMPDISGDWVMITVIIKDETNDGKIYINGTSVETNVAGKDIPVGAADLKIGAKWDNNDGYADFIDEFAIWNITLNEANITELYNSGLGFPYKEPVGNFTFSGVTDDYNGSSILVFNITMYNGTYHEFNTTDGSVETNIQSNSNSLFNITFNAATSYLNDTWLNYNISTDITSFSAIYNMSRYNVSAYMLPTNYTLNGTVNTSTGFSADFNHSILIELPWNTTSYITFSSNNASSETKSVTGATSGDLKYYLYAFNSFILRFLDELTKVLISTQLVELSAISDSYGVNHSTSNGTMRLEFLTPEDYILRYSSDGYLTRSYIQTLNNNSATSLDLYLLNSTDPFTRNVTATVIDKLNVELEDATIIATRYDPTISYSYFTTEKVSTNFDGKASMGLSSNEYYIFQIYYGGELLLTTTPTYILEDTISFVVDTGTDGTEEYFNSQDIDFTIDFSKTTNTFTYTYNDPGLLSSNNCLKVYTVSLLSGETLFNSSCSSSSSGTLIAGVQAVNGTTYKAKAYATLSGTDILLATRIAEYKDTTSFGNTGLFMILALTVVFAFVGAWNPFVALILTPIPLLMGALTGIIAVSTAVIVGVFVAIGFIAIVVGGRS